MSHTLASQHISVSDYLRLEDKSGERYEYYDGKISLMPGGTIAHNTIAANVFGELYAIAKTRNDLRIFGSDQKIYLPRYNFYVYPDTVVVSMEPIISEDEANAIINPILIVEVLSPSTAERDRGTKFMEYSSLDSLKEYVLIRQDAAEIKSMYRESPGHWLETLITGITESIHFNSIDVALKLSDIYRKVL